VSRVERFYLVDGPSYLYRAYHAIGHLSTSRGLPTSATLGMTMMVWKILREEQPDYMAVAWDAPGPTFRHEQFEAYKIQRPGMPRDLVEQLPWVRRTLETLGLPVLELTSYEADDILATVVAQLRAVPVELVLVTADKDALQLVGGRVTVLSVVGRTGERVVYDEAKVAERWGVAPARIPDVLGLMGDAIDNIPGVPGVGEVTAQKLVQQFGSLEGVYENLALVTGPKLREALARAREQAFFSRRLATLDAAVPLSIELETFRVREPDWERLRALWTELEFSTLLRQLPARAVAVASPAVPLVDAAGWTSWLERAGETVAIEPVLTGSAPDLALHGLGAFSPAAGPCFVAGGPRVPEGVRLIGHDLKAFCGWARALGAPVDAARLEDTAVGAYLLNSGRTSYPLEALCLEAVGQSLPGPLATALGGAAPADAAPARLAAWAAARAEGVWALWQWQAARLDADGLRALYRDLEVPLVPVLAAMEAVGIGVAPARLELLAQELERQIDALLAEIQALAGEPVNPNSPKQLAGVLFEKLKLPPIRRTKTGYSTDVEVLEELALGHPLPRKILEYRQLAKLKGTYADALPALVHPRTRRIHTSFNQLVAATGRLSCLPAGTLVSTDRGLLGIEEVRAGDLIRTSQGSRPVLAWEATGIRPVIALRLSNGTTIRCSPDHEFLTLGEWTPAKDLTVRDHVYMSLAEGLFGTTRGVEVAATAAHRTRKSPALPAEWSVDLAELLGYVLADGHIARSNAKPAKLVLAFDWGEDDLVDYFARLVERLFDQTPTRRVSRTCPVLEVSGVDIGGLLEPLGAGAPSQRIRVPPGVFRAPRPIVSALLRGYFEGDGSAAPNLAVRSVSREMLLDVHHLLNVFGIPSTLRGGTPDSRGCAPRYTLRVVGDRSTIRFRDEIGFISGRKRAQLDAFAARSRGVTPAPFLTDAVDGQLCEVTVESIETEPAVPMYEIEVEGGHYVANGIVVHNSSSPNLQNIPIRSELGRRIRQAFIPEPGWRFLAADYSQIELRILAHLSGEEALLEAFRRDEDIHSRTAAEILRVPPSEVTPEMRRLAKVVNFGILYGISGFGLAQAANIGRDESQRLIDQYFAAHPRVRAYLDRTLAEGRERGYVTTLLGRRRYLPELGSRNPAARGAAERMAANAPIQGTASDIIKLAMVRLARVMAERGLESRMLLQVHDELLLEVPEAEGDVVRRLVPEIMESVVALDVPLRVDVKEGLDWADV